LNLEDIFDWEWFIKKFKIISRIDLSAYKRPQMERRINSFMRTSGCTDYKEFIALIRTDQKIYYKFIEHITINVSEFFRNPAHWEIMEKQVIPVLLKQRQQLKVWSAGCSTGEEAYSLAMLFQSKFPGHLKKIEASDLDQEVLNRAQKAVYSNKIVQTLPSVYLNKYMQNEGDSYRIIDEIKSMVNFERQDLLNDPFINDYDLILCRNVFIYLTEDSKQYLYRKFAAALRPGGVLFIGSTEQIFKANEIGFRSLATFFYQKV
jgi:chemotaxis protein methyltransferase CheR